MKRRTYISKLVSLIALPTAIAVSSIPLSSCTINNNNVKKDSIKPHDEKASSIFNLKDGILYGFREGLTQQELLDNMKDNTLVLPECNEIAEGAFRDTILNDAPFGTTITIAASTTTINDFAFYGNTATSVTWSGTPTCTTIGKSAFGRCKKLTTFTIPASVTTIKSDAFMGCKLLAKIDCTALSSCPSLGNKSVFRGTAASGSLTLTDANAETIWSNFVKCGLNSSWSQLNASGGTISKPKTIPTEFLTYSTVNDNEGNATLTITGVNTTVCDITKFNKLVIPATIGGVNVTQIGASAFASKTSLTTLDFSSASNLTTIGANAFDACSGVTSITLHKNLTTINNYAFRNNTSLTTVTIPSGSQLTTIGYYAFDGDGQLKTFAFNNTILKTANQNCFRRTGLTSVTMPNTLKVLGGGIFNGCSSLTTANLGNVTLTSTASDTWLFTNCTSLSSVTLPTNITSLTTKDFNNCTSLKSITIPATVGSIAANTFTGCSALTSVTFSDSTNAFTVLNGSTTVSSSYLATSTSINAQYLTSCYAFNKNSVTIKYPRLTVDNGSASTFSLPYSKNPNISGTISWSSSSTSIATVDSSGKVTIASGKTAGSTVKITATLSGATSTCTITIVSTTSKVSYTELTTTTASAGKNGSPSGEVTVAGVWSSHFVTTIKDGDNGFKGTSNVTKFNLPVTLTTISSGAFQYSGGSDKTINFETPSSITNWNGHAWNNTAVTYFAFPEGITNIKGWCIFAWNNYIKTVKFPSTLEAMDHSGMFNDGGSALTKIDLTALDHVPKLTGSFNYASTTCKFYVKNSTMLAAFKAADGWKNYASSFVVG